MDDIKLLALLHLAEAFAAGDISQSQYMSAIAKLHEEENTRSLTKSWSAHDDDMIPLSQVGRHNFMDKSWSFLNTLSVSNRTFSIAKAFEFVDELDDLLMLKASGKGLPVGEKWQGSSGRWYVKEQRGNKIQTVQTKAPEVKGPAPTTPQVQSGTAATPRPRAQRKATPVVGPPKPRAKAPTFTPKQAKQYVDKVRNGDIPIEKINQELATMSQASINAIKAAAGAKIGGKKAEQAMKLAKRLLERVETHNRFISAEEDRDIWSSIQSIPGVFKAAARYGISAKHLKDVKEYMFDNENNYKEMYRQFWRELRRTVQFGKGLSYKNRIFWDSDYSDPRIAKKYGVKWDEISEHFLKYGSTSGARIPVSYSDDPDSTSENDEASEWLWDFYRRGLPPKPNALKQWKNALEHLIEYKQSQQDQQYSNEDDYVPF